MKKILLLEDNLAALEHLKVLINEIDIKCEIFAFNNIKEAYQCALEEELDLFVIDIILDTSKPGDSSGLKFVDRIRKINRYNFIPVIFVTSLEDAKLYTYEKLHCYSFIEKPFDPDNVKRVIVECLHFPGKDNAQKTLYFRKDGIVLAVEREDIVFVESVKHILNIHLKQGDVLHIPYVTLKKLLEDIDSPDFIQCSRSVIFNRKFVVNTDIPNGVIQLKDNFGRLETGMIYKKRLREVFK